jgi:hypothetical protein
MENKIIKCRIDVSKIDKSKIFNGQKGKWYDFTLIASKTEYSDFLIVEETTSDERKEGKRGTILGNAKYPEQQQDKKNESDTSDVMPF